MLSAPSICSSAAAQKQRAQDGGGGCGGDDDGDDDDEEEDGQIRGAGRNREIINLGVIRQVLKRFNTM